MIKEEPLYAPRKVRPWKTQALPATQWDRARQLAKMVKEKTNAPYTTDQALLEAIRIGLQTMSMNMGLSAWEHTAGIRSAQAHGVLAALKADVPYSKQKATNASLAKKGWGLSPLLKKTKDYRRRKGTTDGKV